MTDMEMGLHLTAVGIPIVFGVLAVVAFVVFLVSRLEQAIEARRAAREAAGVAPEPAKPQKPTIDDTTLVLITAAAATMIQGRFHIRRIRRIGGPGQTAWFQQGRATLHGSHNVVPKPRNS
ncbi:MAG: hypothetical protein EP329_07305 [Deltaproteobacteria bacterium]|nr:MAG: hypothetical protein EP329_07305 [Deltaproteobacteria bacterium]